MAIVYQHKKKDTDEIFYIGISNVGKERAYKKSNRTLLWHNIVKKHGLVVEILFQNIALEQAFRIEKYLISFYGKKYDNTGILCNFTDGGEGGSLGYIQSEETREKKRQANYKRVYKKGVFNHSEETKRKISEKLKIIMNSPQRLEIMKDIGSYKRTALHKQMVSEVKSKKVHQLSIDGKFIKEFSSMTKAAEAVGGDSSKISLVCNGKRNSHKNFKWIKV